MNILKRLTLTDIQRNKAYKNITICEEWYNYQMFAYWYDNYISQLNPNIEYQIDKDILQMDIKNKIYSPNTCCLVPKQINEALSNGHVERVKEIGLPVGVHSSGNKYIVNISVYGESIFLGMFDTIDDAFNAYKYTKEKYIKELANYYFSINALHKDIYDILCNINIKP